jgi:K+-transporting ATPase KdpF subunit
LVLNRHGLSKKEIKHGHINLVAGDVCTGHRHDASLLLVSRRQRKNLREEAVMLIYVTIGVAALMFIYLFTALIRPEWF